VRNAVARRPELGKGIKHLVFAESAVDRHPPVSALPWEHTDLVVQGLQRLLGSNPPSTWRRSGGSQCSTQRYQDSEDDGATNPLPSSCWANLSKLRTLTLYRDLLYNRNERQVLLHPHRTFLRASSSSSLVGCTTTIFSTGVSRRSTSSRPLEIEPRLSTRSASSSAWRDSPRPPHLDSLQLALMFTVAAASRCRLALKVTARYTGDAHLQVPSLV
jgi:hypothetical protein